MLNIVMFGAPGSGKGTQSDLIAARYSLMHFSTGDMLRAEIALKSAIGQQAQEFISKGNLVPDELIIDMIRQRIDGHEAEMNGFIFDGFPRTVAQAKALDALLQERNKKVHMMLDLQVEEDKLIERLLLRGITSGRSDDNMEVIKNRLDVYNSVTLPVMDYYKQTGRYTGINGSSTIEENFERIVNMIESVDAAYAGLAKQ